MKVNKEMRDKSLRKVLAAARWRANDLLELMACCRKYGNLESAEKYEKASKSIMLAYKNVKRELI